MEIGVLLTSVAVLLGWLHAVREAVATSEEPRYLDAKEGQATPRCPYCHEDFFAPEPAELFAALDETIVIDLAQSQRQTDRQKRRQ